MGQCKKQIPHDKLLYLRIQRKSIKYISKYFGGSTASLSRRISESERDKGLITRYLALQYLDLAALHASDLEAITTERIERGSLMELMRSFLILNKVALTN